MRTAQIGSLEVSVIGLGCNNFGRALDKTQSAAVVNAALDAGMSHFDTASNYGEGQSESFLGAALGGRRHEVVIATKVGVAIPGWEGSGGASPGYVRQVLERSLTELGTDYVDLFMIHFPDSKTPIEDTLQVMNELVEEGKVREIGCSNFDPAQLTEALEVSEKRGWPAFVCDQVQYSIVHRSRRPMGWRSCAPRWGWHCSPSTRWPTGFSPGRRVAASSRKGACRWTATRTSSPMRTSTWWNGSMSMRESEG
jgi:aryl-alcohol dehydrogenase-like predicted oxidoreductase